LTTQQELWQTPRGAHLTFGQEMGVGSLAALLRFMEAVLTPLSTSREPNAGRQARLAAGAERRLLGVGFRVEPVVAQPAPPQSRT